MSSASEYTPYVESFNIDSCEKIKLVYKDYKKGKSTGKVRTAEIVDTETITQVLNLLRQLPDKGEMFISFLPVSSLEVTLTLGDDGRREHFMYHNGMLKTPDTTFYDSRREEEKELYQLLLGEFR